jgi:hypothetical protein
MTQEAHHTAAWRPVDPRLAGELVDARLQTHHAAQLAAAIGISYLAHEADDSHTNLGWMDAAESLASRSVRGSSTIRLAVRPHPFALLILNETGATEATFALHGHSLSDAATWVRSQLASHGIDPAAYTLAKHYTIPPHPVATAVPFDASNAAAFEQLSRAFSNASLLLEQLAAGTPSASEVRCWPHHFDLATLVEVVAPRGGAPGKTVGVGMEPGDLYYREPYYYVNPYPAPPAGTPLPALLCEGVWHTHEWLGAVLPSSRITSPEQESQGREFLRSAVAACTQLLAPS